MKLITIFFSDATNITLEDDDDDSTIEEYTTKLSKILESNKAPRTITTIQYEGSIGMFRFWDRMLTPKEIRYLAGKETIFEKLKRKSLQYIVKWANNKLNQ